MQSILCQAYPIHLGNGVLCYTHRFLHLGSVTLDTNLKDNDLLVWPDALSDIRLFTPKWQRRSDTDTQQKYPVRILTFFSDRLSLAAKSRLLNKARRVRSST